MMKSKPLFNNGGRFLFAAILLTIFSSSQTWSQTPLVADFTANPPWARVHPAHNKVTFNDFGSSNGGFQITNWKWNFEHGSPTVIDGENSVVDVRYWRVGKHNVSLEILNSNGESASRTKLNEIAIHPWANFDVQPGSVLEAGREVRFTNLSLTGTGNETFEFSWLFNGCNVQKSGTSPLNTIIYSAPGNSSPPNPTDGAYGSSGIVWDTPGRKEVVLVVSGPEDTWHRVPKTIVITAPSPLQIKGINAEHYCWRNTAIQLSATVEGGFFPLSYEWLEWIGSTWIPAVSLSDPSIPNPRIISVPITPATLRYKLRISDGSAPTPAVAEKEVDIDISDPFTMTFDLSMRDDYDDLMKEPNWDSPNVWESVDLWNRVADDDGTEHQAIEYEPGLNNYLYARVRNTGCDPSPPEALLRLYWTQAALGTSWPFDWVNGWTGAEVTAGNPLPIPVLLPGEETIIKQPWLPPDPAYRFGLPAFAACLLARIETDDAFNNFGMTNAELYDINYNVRYNNNIVTRDTDLRRFWMPSNGVVGVGTTIMANNATVPRAKKISIRSDRHSPGDSFLEIGRIVVTLEEAFYDRWVQGGQQSLGLQYIGDHEFEITDPAEAAFKQIWFDQHESFPLTLRCEITETIDIAADASYKFQVEQGPDDGSPAEEVYGIDIQLVNGIQPERRGLPFHEFEESEQNDKQRASVRVSLFPNPVADELHCVVTSAGSEQATLVLHDMFGRALFSRRLSLKTGDNNLTLPVNDLAVGSYYLNIRQHSSGLSVRKSFLKQ